MGAVTRHILLLLLVATPSSTAGFAGVSPTKGVKRSAQSTIKQINAHRQRQIEKAKHRTPQEKEKRRQRRKGLAAAVCLCICRRGWR